jgi:hypothetical protein
MEFSGDGKKNPLEFREAATHRRRQSMKPILFLIVCFVGQFAFGRETAYQALRAVGAARGEALMNRVIEVQGRHGTSQPATWKIVIDDPAARGGVRELEVSNGKIVSERTPVRAYSGASDAAVMDFKRLNLDSEGAFTVANQEASKSRMGFDNVDYVLRRDDQGTMPVWMIQLNDVDGRRVGSYQISADNGAIIRKGAGRAVEADLPPEGDIVVHDREETERPHRRNIAHEMDKYLHRAGGQLQEWITGRRTIDRRFDGE